MHIKFTSKKMLFALVLIIFLFVGSCSDRSRDISDLPWDVRDMIIENTDDLYSIIPVFYRKSGVRYPLDLDTVENIARLSEMILKEKLLFTTQAVAEDKFLQDSTIYDNTKMALDIKAKNPWHIQIPDSIATNYLLPYKVMYEKNGPWQKIFRDRFGSILSFIPQKKLSKKEIDSLIEMNLKLLDTVRFFKGKEGSYRISSWPGISEIMMEKSGDCQSESIKNVYLYRSLGIPATIDFTPFYGGGNAGHSSAVSWDSDIQKFKPKKGQGFISEHRVSKAFRWTFKKSNAWVIGIVPLLDPNIQFPIFELQNNHWIDVTKEYTDVRDISLSFPEAHGKIAYICTYSYGKWRPIFYGARTGKSRFIFKNMGTDILYRGGYYDSKGKFNLKSNVFLLERNGNLKIVNNENLYSKPNPVRIRLEKNNYGEDAWLKRKKSYRLLALNPKGDWDTISSRSPDRDSLITFPEFKTRRQIFALMENGAERRLERPFYIVKDSVVWY